MTDPARELSEIAALMVTDRRAAADRVDRLADQLRALAARLREADVPASTGGACDRVRVVLVGPDSQVKHDSGPPPTLSDPD